MLSDLTGTPEQDLLDQATNVQCQHCGLIYKQQWFSRDLLVRLFTERVPSHPKGWDVLSGRFSPDNFQTETAAYEQALQHNDTGQINRYRRALSSIIDSIPELEDTSEAEKLLEAIETGDTKELRAADPLLRRTMTEPAPYKRFSGFSAEGLWQYINRKLGGLNSWAEVGCPLWGLLPRAKQNGVDATYLHRPEPNYWQTGCRTNGTHCTDHLVQTTGINTANWNDQPEQPWDAIGAFQYLDHLEKPGDFMTQLFQKSKAAAIILDTLDQPVYIQHLTGWTKDAIHWLAEKHGCEVHDDFEDIRASGNQLFLLQRN